MCCPPIDELEYEEESTLSQCTNEFRCAGCGRWLDMNKIALSGISTHICVDCHKIPEIEEE